MCCSVTEIHILTTDWCPIFGDSPCTNNTSETCSDEMKC